MLDLNKNCNFVSVLQLCVPILVGLPVTMEYVNRSKDCVTHKYIQEVGQQIPNIWTSYNNRLKTL